MLLAICQSHSSFPISPQLANSKISEGDGRPSRDLDHGPGPLTNNYLTSISIAARVTSSREP